MSNFNNHQDHDQQNGTRDDKNRHNWVPISEQPAYTPRKLRVVCVGAGYAGLMVAYKWKHEYHMDDFVDLTIYEKNSDVGGTWLENRYPGVACDVSRLATIEKSTLGNKAKLTPYDRFQPISTLSRLSPIPIGRRSTPQAQRSGTISRGRLRSITSTNVCNSTPRSYQPSGTTPKENGSSRYRTTGT
jgi:hypothetical protein